MVAGGLLITIDLETAESVDDREVVARVRAALTASGLTVLKQQAHEFTPQGITAVWVLSESHCAVHTWPESSFVSIDCYTCGDEAKAMAFGDGILAAFEVARSSVRRIKRGFTDG